MDNQQKFAARYFSAFAEFLVSRRNPSFYLMVVLSFVLVIAAGPIRIDNSLEVWFLEDDPTLKAYNEFKDRYGSDFEVILALVNCGEKGVFSPEKLNEIWEVSKKLEADKTTFKRILSVSLAPYVGLDGETLIIEDLMKNQVLGAADAELVMKRFFEDPSRRKVLLDSKSQHAMILIELVSTPDIDQRRPKIIEQVREHFNSLDYRLAGMGVMHEELNRVSMEDGALFTFLAYLIIAILILLIYRSWVMLKMAIAAMIISAAGLVGVYGLSGQSFNMVTIVLPTLIMILSISDVAYVYNSFCFNIEKIMKDREAGLLMVMNEVVAPCFFTSLTNFCGFLAIVASPMAVLRVFGAFGAFASMAEYFVSMIVAAFVLGRIQPSREQAVISRPFAGLVKSWVRHLPKMSWAIMLTTVILVILQIYGISQLKVDTFSMGFLPESNQVRQDNDYIESVYGNYLPVEIRLMTNKKDGIKNPDFLLLLDEAHRRLEALPLVNRANSILDAFKRLNQVMSDGASESYRVPDTYNAASQLMMMYESDPENDLEYMTDAPEYSEARLTVRVPMISASEVRAVEQSIHEVLHEIFDPHGIALKFGGYVPLYSRIINYITNSQIQSFILAFLFVFGAVALFFRRLDAMLLVILPNLFPIGMTLGIMGLTGINLDNATVTIAAITMGIVVDDTIHELFLFCEPSKAGLEPVDAISESLVEAGPAVISTSLLYGLGFLVFAFARIKSVVYFGTLLSLTVFFALLCEFTVLPAQICLFRRFLKKK
ncbi:MAG: MMPL family transporter [Candidatus Riflebacteria bacterium]